MKMHRRCCRLGHVHSSMCLQRLAVSEAKAALQEHHGQHECWDSQTAMSQLAVSILQKSQMAATPKKRYWQAVPRSTDEQDDLVCSCSRHTSVDCRTAARMLPWRTGEFFPSRCNRNVSKPYRIIDDTVQRTVKASPATIPQRTTGALSIRLC